MFISNTGFAVLADSISDVVNTNINSSSQGDLSQKLYDEIEEDKGNSSLNSKTTDDLMDTHDDAGVDSSIGSTNTNSINSMSIDVTTSTESEVDSDEIKNGSKSDEEPEEDAKDENDSKYNQNNENNNENTTKKLNDIDGDISSIDSFFATSSEAFEKIFKGDMLEKDGIELASYSEIEIDDEEQPLFGRPENWSASTSSKWGNSWGIQSFVNERKGQSTEAVIWNQIGHQYYHVYQECTGNRRKTPIIWFAVRYKVEGNALYAGPLFQHVYSGLTWVSGNYWERWDMSGNLRSKLATFLGWAKKITFDGAYFSTVSMENCFQNNTLIEEVIFNNNQLCGSGITTLKNAFSGCTNLKRIKFGNMKTTNLTTMEGAFENCTSLEEIDFGSEFDLSNVTNMSRMLKGCTNIKKIVLPKNFAANLTDLSSIFEGCTSLATISVAEDLRGLPSTCIATDMFKDCTSLVGGGGGMKYDPNYTDGIFCRVDYGGILPGYLTCSNQSVYDNINITIDNHWADNITKTSIKKIKFVKDNLMEQVESEFEVPTNINDTKGYLKDSNETVVIHFAHQIPKLKTTTDWTGFFKEFVNLENIEGLGYIDTSTVTDMTEVFKDCTSLTSVALGEIDIKNVVKVDSVFENCSSLIMLTGHIASFSSLESASKAFKGCTSLPIFVFDVCDAPTLQNVSSMFEGCSSLTTIYVDDNYSGLPAGVVSTDMFKDCTSLVGGEGFGYNSLAPITDGSVANVDYGGIKPGYFTIIDLSKYENAKFKLPTNWYSLHAEAVVPKSQITKIKFYNDATGVGNYDHNFYMSDTDGTRFFIEGNTVKIHYGSRIPKLKVNGNWSGFFKDFTNLTTIEGLDDKIDTTEVTNISELFSGCTSLKRVNFNPNTPKVTDMSKVFFGCASLSEVRIGSNLKLNRVTTLESAFEGCVSLSMFDIGIASFSNIQNLRNAFKDCKSLTRFKFDVCSLDYLTTTEGMFSGCTNLRTIYVSDSFQGLSSTTVASTDMFKDCVNIVGGQGFAYSNGVHPITDGRVARVDYGGIMPGYYTIYGTPMQVKERYSHAQFNLPSGWFNNAIAAGVNKDSVIKIKFYNDDSSGTNIGIGNYDGTYIMSTTENTVGYYENEKDSSGNPTGNVIAKIHFGHLLPHLKVGKDFSGFFKDFKNVKKIEGIEKLNLSDVEDMSELFSGCESLESITITPDISHVKEMDRLYYNCKSLRSVNLGENVNLGNVETLESAFENCESLTTAGFIIRSTVPLSHIKSFKNTFKNCKSFTAFSINAGNADTLTNLEGMFSGCENLTIVNTKSINLANIETTKDMFYNCKKLKTFVVGNSSNFATISNLERMFYNCESLTSLPEIHALSDRVTTMKAMFASCSNLTKVAISNVNTHNLVSDGFKDMFLNCKKMTSITLGKGLVLGNATDLSNMFNNCESLKYINLSSFSSNKIVDVSNMFKNNRNLEMIVASNSFAIKNKLGTDMFLNCDKLVGGDGTSYRIASVNDSSYAQVDFGTVNPGYFTWGDPIITFKSGEGATGTMKPLKIARGVPTTIGCGFKRRGYMFSGWSDELGNFFGTTLIAIRSMTLVANWVEVKSNGWKNTGGGGGGAKVKGSGIVQNQERSLNFVLGTPIKENEYIWVFDELGRRNGILLNVNSVVGKAMLNSNRTKGAYILTQDGNSMLLCGGGLYRISSSAGEECVAFDSSGSIMTGFIVMSSQTKVLDVAIENVFAITNTGSLDEDKVFIESKANLGKYYLYERDDFRGRLWNQPIYINGVQYTFDANGKVISSSDSTLSQGVWEYNPIENKWKYYTPDINGKARYYVNTSCDIFYNGKICKYIFDDYGNLMTGYFTWNGQNYYGIESGQFIGAVSVTS